MNETKFEIFYRLLNDDGRAPWQPAGTLDGLVWNGTMQLRITGDAAPLALPFELGNEDILILAVKEHSHDIMNTANSIIAQTLTRVDRTTGNVFVYSRSRRTVAGKQQWSEWEALNGATTAMLQDGSVTTPKLAADVREKVDNPLRPLFIAAGAEYNDSGADMTKTAPWGETVTHKAGHYYLNGLGDITEEQMMEIYNAGEIASTKCAYFYEKHNIRTTLKSSVRGYVNEKMFLWYLCYNCREIVVFNALPDDSNISSIHASFTNCDKLRYIMPILNVNGVVQNDLSAFGYCTSLVNVRLKGISNSINFMWSPNINKASILYAIQNASVVTEVTVNLHPDAYARLANDADIIAALETQPLVSLVSA